MSKTTIGIDIGSCELKLALCGGGAVQRLVSEPLPDQLVRDGRVVSPEAMAAFLKETVKKHRLSARRCALVLPASQAFARRTLLPAMTLEQLQLNLPYEFRDYITEEKDKYFYDYAVLRMERDEAGKPAQMELMAAAALKTVIHSYRDICRWAGLKLVTALPTELAYVNLLHRCQEANPQEEREYCIIDLGHSATRVYIFTGLRFEVSRVIEFGGIQLDNAIADAFHVDVHIARARKVANREGELELQACQDQYRAMAVDLMRGINFYRYSNPGSQLDTAWLCGGGSRIVPLVEQLSETLSMELHPISDLLALFGAGAEQADLCPAAIGAAQQ